MAVATFDTLKFAVLQVNFKELVTKDDLVKEVRKSSNASVPKSTTRSQRFRFRSRR